MADETTEPASTSELLAQANARWLENELKPTLSGEAEAAETTTEQETPVEETGAETSGMEQSEPTTGRKPEGLSPQLLRRAYEFDVPQSLIDSARDDAQLAQFIAMVGPPDREEVADPAQGVIDALRAGAPIPDDQFDATDPVHVATRELAAKHDKTLEVLSKLLKSTSGLVQTTQQSAKQQLEKEFDAGIDALGHADHFGSPYSPQRQEVFATFDALRHAHPDKPVAELVKRAAYAVYTELVTAKATQAQTAALTKQNGQKLGAGPAKAPAPKPTTAREQLLAALKRADANSIKARGY